jgi:biotin synthase-like enzyme
MQALIFYAGANGYISGDYLTTKGRGVEADDEMIGRLGLTKRHGAETKEGVFRKEKIDQGRANRH